jgi:GTP-binding protein YchF
MKLGIVGLPNVGKSTLFNSLTQAGAESANYPFCTIDPNVGMVSVPDERVDKLTEMYKSVKRTPAVIEFVDIAGLVKGASKGEGLGNQFLAHIREVDAIIHVVRCFEDSNVVHVEDSVDPIRDIETIDIELALADMDMVSRRLAKVSKTAKTDKSYQREADLLAKIEEALEKGNKATDAIRNLGLSKEDLDLVASFNLLTAKPVLYAANVSEDGIAEGSNPHVEAVARHAEKEGSQAFAVCAKIEEEIGELDETEKAAFLEDLGISESGLVRLVKASYKLLGLISFLTAGPKESRAWTIANGTKAPGAAGKIHSDFERGFIRAEIVAYDDLMRLGSYQLAKERGLVRSEGKDYVMKDGDVTLFRFNV